MGTCCKRKMLCERDGDALVGLARVVAVWSPEVVVLGR